MGPVMQVSFAGARELTELNLSVQQIKIRQVEYLHEVCVVTLAYQDKNSQNFAEGSRVTVRYGWGPRDTDYFYGYVHHTEQNEADSERRELHVWCVGPSWPFKQSRQRTYRDATVTSVAATLANEHNFSLAVSSSDVVFPTVSQAGRSDWQLLVWMARRVGFTVYANRTELVVSAREIDESNTRQVPTFQLIRGAALTRNTCLSISSDLGKTTPNTAWLDRSMSGVADDGTIITAGVRATDRTGGGSALLSEQVVDTSRSRLDAAQRLAGADRLNRFRVRATAALSGDVRVTQGATIRITNSSRLDDGLWYVEAAEHTLVQSGTYETTVTLARDSLGDTVASPVVSVSGKPLVLAGCDVAVDTVLMPPPPSTYALQGSCPPLAPAGDGLRRDSPARRLLAAQVVLGDPAPAAAGPTPRIYTGPARDITAWRAKTALVRKK